MWRVEERGGKWGRDGQGQGGREGRGKELLNAPPFSPHDPHTPTAPGASVICVQAARINFFPYSPTLFPTSTAPRARIVRVQAARRKQSGGQRPHGGYATQVLPASLQQLAVQQYILQAGRKCGGSVGEEEWGWEVWGVGDAAQVLPPAARCTATCPAGVWGDEGSGSVGDRGMWPLRYCLRVFNSLLYNGTCPLKSPAISARLLPGPVNSMTQNLLKRVLDQCINHPCIVNWGLAAAWQRRLESYMLNSSPVLPALQLPLSGCCIASFQAQPSNSFKPHQLNQPRSSPALPAPQPLLLGCCQGARRRPAQQLPQTDSPARAAVGCRGAVPPAGGTARRTVRISGAVRRPGSGALSWRGTWPAGCGGRPGSRQA